MSNEGIESNVVFVELNDNVALKFVYIPDGYKVKSVTMEKAKVTRLCKLSSFNRVKLLSKMRADNPNTCIVETFKKILTRRGWDFLKHPNPTAFVVQWIKPQPVSQSNS